jgi:acetyltransferase-like isoleucine patch superfamily enzyme
MLSGDPFQPSAQLLEEEREGCKGAVFRFNNTSNSAVDITRETRDRHFREILMARWTHHTRGRERPVCGHLGPGVRVDTPFKCDYGYNLSIADNVEIGANCIFLDSGRISIGRNSTIGANVTIDTVRTPNDPKTIKGVRRTCVAAEVHIGENVHIGPSCTITAGVSIGNGTIILPGSIVVRVSDLPYSLFTA